MISKIENYWWNFGSKKNSVGGCPDIQTDCGWLPMPLVGNPSVLDIKESESRFVQHPSGAAVQVISVEPLGEPYISLHQNHYAACQGKAGSHLGSVRFGAKDDTSASISAFADGQWSSSSHPTGLSFRVSPPGSFTARHPVMTMKSDGSVHVGSPNSSSSSMTSFGVHRPGTMQLPTVEKFEDLTQTDETFTNGSIVYVKAMDKVVISQGGEWHTIVTTPVEIKKNTELGGDSRGFGAMRPVGLFKRQIGEPRQDGKPVIFGPRISARTGGVTAYKA